MLLRTGYSASRSGFDRAAKTWRPLLGERLLVLDDYRNLAELVVSAIQVNEGVDADVAAGSWSDPATATSVRNALSAPKKSGGSVSRWFR